MSEDSSLLKNTVQVIAELQSRMAAMECEREALRLEKAIKAVRSDAIFAHALCCQVTLVVPPGAWEAIQQARKEGQP